MTPAETVTAPEPPAHVQLIQMCAGGWVAAALYAAAKLGIADHLALPDRNAPRQPAAHRRNGTS